MIGIYSLIVERPCVCRWHSNTASSPHDSSLKWHLNFPFSSSCRLTNIFVYFGMPSQIASWFTNQIPWRICVSRRKLLSVAIDEEIWRLSLFIRPVLDKRKYPHMVCFSFSFTFREYTSIKLNIAANSILHGRGIYLFKYDCFPNSRSWTQEYDVRLHLFSVWFGLVWFLCLMAYQPL